jgi:hypothetical protein
MADGSDIRHLVYGGNKPTCAHCGEPIEDSDPREQRAGKVYHTNIPNCREAYNATETKPQDATSGPQVAESGDQATEADDSASDDLQLSDDDLARSWITLSEEGRRLIKMADGALFALESRLIERGAEKFVGEHFRGAMKKAGYDHTIDDQERFMERLKGYVSEPVYERAFPQPSTPDRGVDHRVLNDLIKLGGPVAAIIEEERRSAERRPKLKIEPIVQEQEEEIPYE